MKSLSGNALQRVGRFLASEVRRLGLRWLLLAALLSLVLTVLVFVAFYLLGSPRTLSVVAARAEQVSFLVANPEQARLDLSGFRLWSDEHPEGGCLTGLLEPTLAARVTYRRRGSLLEIEVEPPEGEDPHSVRLRPNKSAAWSRLSGTVELVAEGAMGSGGIEPGAAAAGQRCNAPNNAPHLPIWGPGAVGDVLALRQDEWTYTLLEGSLHVYGRTLAIPLLAKGGSLYPVFNEPMWFPPGSRLSTDRGRSSQPRDALIGFATINGSGSLDVAVSTEAGRLELFPPGGRSEPVGIEISLFSQALNDPNVLQVQVLILIFIFLLPILLSVGNVIIAERQENWKGERQTSSKNGDER